MPDKLIKETDLYEPVKQLLQAQGFVVKGEVKGCDIVAVREDALWVVEMKLQFNMTLLYQAMTRLPITDQVFVAVPRPRRANDKHFRIAQQIVKKLELGLIVVAIDSPVRTAEILLFPGGKSNKNNKKTMSVRREIAGRTGDTAGGATKTPVNTAYRERCIKIACLIERSGPLTAAELKNTFQCEKDAYRIMRQNHYGWYMNTGKGRFALTDEGKKYLTENSSNSVVAYYRMKAAQYDEED